MKKKIYGLTIVISIIMSLMPCINADEALKYGVLSYQLINNEIIITDCDEDVEGELVIPSEIDGVAVTQISSTAFSSCKKFSSIVLPETITTIGMQAFLHCTSLERCNIPASVTSIGSYAFVNCTNLISIDVNPNNDVYSSDSGVLFNKDKTKLIHCPATKTEYTIPDTVTDIDKYAFRESKITHIIIPDSVVNLCEGAFLFCYDLETALLSNKITCINSKTFVGCKKLESITMPNSITTISNGAITACPALTDIYYSGTQAEWDNIEMNEAQSNILHKATIHCSDGDIATNPTPTPQPTINPAKRVTYGDLTYDITDYDAIVISCNKSASGKLIIPDTVEDKPVTEISSNAFFECSELTDVELSNNITLIDYSAFFKCSKLKSITIPESLIIVNDMAFHSCTALETVKIPYGVDYIGTEVFLNCTSLKSIDVDPNNTEYSSIGGVLLSKDQSVLICCPPAKTEFTIPDTVNTIEDWAFAFGNLTNIKIPDTVTYIGYAAFNDCRNLEKINVPKSMSCINQFVFCDVNKITSINIPKNVTKISYCAFLNCANIQDVYYEGTEDEWNNIEIEDGNHLIVRATIHYNSQSSGPVYSIGKLTLKTNSVVSINVNLNGSALGTPALILALYDNDGTFIGLRTEYISATDKEQTFDFDISSFNAGKAKAFIWNSFDDMQALSNTQELDL